MSDYRYVRDLAGQMSTAFVGKTRRRRQDGLPALVRSQEMDDDRLPGGPWVHDAGRPPIRFHRGVR